MALYPRATKQLIPPGANDPKIEVRTGILHVDGGDVYNLHDFFDGRSGGIESHMHIPKEELNGIRLFQYRNTDFEADANFKANPFAMSVETQGRAAGTWTNHQIREIKELIIWAKVEPGVGIPLRVMQTWDDPKGGWGYHTMWGSPSMWTPNVKSCPGEQRKEQFWDLLVPWMKDISRQGVDDMFEASDRQNLSELLDLVKGLNTKLNKIERREKARDKRWGEFIRRRFNLTDEQLDEVLTALNELE